MINVEVLDVYDHFATNGLYKIKVNGRIGFIFRNGDSWGVLSHYIGEPVTGCMDFMRDDLIEPVEKAIKEYWKEHQA